MCITDKKHYVFHSPEYSLTLHLHRCGGLSGFLTILLDYNTIRYPLSGFYLSRNDSIEFTFFVEWGAFPEEENFGYTGFSGHLVNDHILIVDWMLVQST